MPTYAKDTEVPADRSRAEIERTLSRYGATGFLYAWQEGRAVVGFTMRGRSVRIGVPLPDPDDEEFTRTDTGRVRAPGARQEAYDQAVRQRWRAVALVIKAKLEAVEAGITEFNVEFLAHLILPGGQTVGDWVMPRVEEAYSSGHVPPLESMLEGPAMKLITTTKEA